MHDHLKIYLLHILYFVLSISVGQYKYGDETFEASASPSGASYSKCKDDAVKALKVDEACTHMKCSFGGIWNGGGGAGQKNLFVASFFFDRAAEVRFSATDSELDSSSALFVLSVFISIISCVCSGWICKPQGSCG